MADTVIRYFRAMSVPGIPDAYSATISLSSSDVRSARRALGMDRSRFPIAEIALIAAIIVVAAVIAAILYPSNLFLPPLQDYL